jgi:predicted Zn finger-like uncharacterized protein
MILVCPSCDTRYFADDSKIGKDGRRVRCATCGHAWTARAPDDEGAPAAVEDTGLTREAVERLRQTAEANSRARAGPHAEFRAQQQARRRRERIRAVGIAWAGVAFVSLSALGVAVLFRNDIASTFPRLASLYQLVGLEVNRFGIVLENVAAKRSFDGTTPVLTVTGVAVNTGQQARATPQLRVTLKDETGKDVQTWTDALSVAMLGPGERTEFTTRFEAPPVETYRLSVTFAETAGEGASVAAAPAAPATEGTAAAEPAAQDAAGANSHGADLHASDAHVSDANGSGDHGAEAGHN